MASTLPLLLCTHEALSNHLQWHALSEWKMLWPHQSRGQDWLMTDAICIYPKWHVQFVLLIGQAHTLYLPSYLFMTFQPGDSSISDLHYTYPPKLFSREVQIMHLEKADYKIMQFKSCIQRCYFKNVPFNCITFG